MFGGLTCVCFFFIFFGLACLRPLYNIDSGGGSQQGGGVGGGMERDSRIESPKRRTRNEPHVASPIWKATHVTEARKIRPAPHKRFSMSLRWLMKKQQKKEPNKKKKAIVDQVQKAERIFTTVSTNVPPDTTLMLNTTPTKQKEVNTVDASNNKKGTTKVNKAKHKKKKKKTPKKQEFDLDSELASLKHEFAKGI